jgi:hypothetical protein
MTERALAEAAEPVDRLGRHRAGPDVAADHDRVGGDDLDLRQHGVERREVAVDVVEGRDPHGRIVAHRRLSRRRPARSLW